MHLKETLTSDTHTKVMLGLFVIFTIWWFWLHSGGAQNGVAYLLFGAVYGTTTALYGSIVGFFTAGVWGGRKSVMGRAMLFLSFGLLAQFFGQAAFSFYNILLGIDVPYPSIADIGYFGNIPLYLMGMILLARASGVSVSLRSFRSQFAAVVIPLLMVLFTYVMFLREYEFVGTPALTIFLDFAYPIGQGLYVSIAILTFGLSRKILGGVMRSRIFLLILALVAQYVADFNFLYQAITGTWSNGGYGDYLYLVAYVLMGIGIFQMRQVNYRIKSATESK